MADRPWVMRTYSGHSSARASNELYRTNLAKGQTGLSVAFDLPTQTGYDPDHPLARGEVGKVGVPVPHLGEMRTLFDGIPLDEMNTSMTINATAMWLLAHVHRAGRGAGRRPRRCSRARRRTTSSRSTCRAARTSSGPSASRRLTVDLITPHGAARARRGTRSTCARTTCRRRARRRCRSSRTGWRPRSACSTRCATSGQVADDEFPEVVGRISFFIERGHPLRRGDVQDARVRARCGTASCARALRRRPTRSCAASATACR